MAVSNVALQDSTVAPAPVTLQDKYLKPRGRVYMTGTQALVRLLLAQKQRDEAQGLNTAGFVSGYRGSPLGGVDHALWQAQAQLEANQIRFTPGLNEELAATAVWGSQMVALDSAVAVDGVFALWYGKGPGVDRSGDVFKHGNIAGTSRLGGVIAVAGDDHACKSSTLPHQSEHAFIAAMMPVLNPSGVREFVEFGLHGWAMSRYSGCWVGFKAISDTIETSASFDLDPMAVDIRIPDSYPIPPGGFSIRWPDAPLEQESRLQRERLYAVLEYVRVNGLNRQPWDVPQATFGIVATGKSYLDTLEALALIGIDEAVARRLGIRLLKIGVSWPLEPDGVRAFAEGLTEILVVEEKRQIIEYQMKEQFYNHPPESRPRIVGKYDEAGEWVKVPHDGILLSPNGELDAQAIARAIVARLLHVLGGHGLPPAAQRFMPALATPAPCGLQPAAAAALPQRVPYFCSGCPHNTSTRVPEGSRALAGIGCHYMVMWMDRRTETFTQMGGEGVTWIGQAPFTGTRHVFANLGDGTFTHSGSLAIRAAVAAGVNITYKILYNDAVAMTGGQPVEGQPSVTDIVRIVAAERVSAVHLVSDEPERFAGERLPSGSRLLHRDELDGLQRELRETPGVTVIVYAQTCAAEKRRRRKRHDMPDPPRRVVINPDVCEGCGDCGVKSNCVSIVPVDTPLGRKRAIDQSTCNKDFSCIDGFCPSFVTVEGGQLRKPVKQRAAAPSGLPEPTLPVLDKPWNTVVTGVGGTGVVTIGALMGMAAHIEGKGVLVLDMAGLAQKGGAVMTHIRLAAEPDGLYAARIAPGEADLLLGCDLMVAAGREAEGMLEQARTRAVLNSDVAPTGAFTQDPDWRAPVDELAARVAARVREHVLIESTRLASGLMGDSVATNVFMLGYAWQKGWVPLGHDALMQAIELNGTAVDMNRAAFAWGRQAAVAIDVARRAAGLQDGAQIIPMPQRPPSLEAIMKDRRERLTAYQNAAYAERYERFVMRIADLEQAKAGSTRLAREVAISLFKLMAYKDEYEVARLYVDTGFLEQVARQFEPGYTLQFHLAPPLFARKGRDGEPAKRPYGQWMIGVYRLLARAKFLRGTAFDVFGHTQERRTERADIAAFEQLSLTLAEGLDGNDRRMALALELARLPQRVRGFGHVREGQRREAVARQAELLAQWHGAGEPEPFVALQPRRQAQSRR